MNPIHVAINAVVHVTAWLTLVWLATQVIQRLAGPVRWRVLALRLGLAGVPAVLALGIGIHALPFGRSIIHLRAAQDRPAAGAILPAAPVGQARSASVAATVAPRPTRLADATGGESSARVASSPNTTQSGGGWYGRVASGWAGLVRSRWLIWASWLGGMVWLAGVAVGGWRLCDGLIRLGRRRRTWKPVRSPAVRRLAADVAGRVGLVRPFRLVVGDGLPMPVAMGVRRPTVVLPREQSGYLATPEGRAVLAHELAHLRLADPFWRMVGALVGVLWWFHPLMIWLNRRAEIEAEYLCDQTALGLNSDRHGYARLLVGLAELAWADRPLAAAAIGAVHRADHLERRLKMILSRTAATGTALNRRGQAAAVALASMLLLALSSVALLGEEGLGLEAQLRGGPPPSPPRLGRGDAPRPPDAPPRPAGDRPANRVLVTLKNGEKVEGVWLGAGPEGIRVYKGEGVVTIVLERISEIKMLGAAGGRPPAVEPERRPERPEVGGPQAGRPRPAEGLPPGGEHRRPPAEGERGLGLGGEGERRGEAAAGRAGPEGPRPTAPLNPELARRAAEIREAVRLAEARLRQARELPTSNDDRGAAIEAAERELVKARQAAEEFERTVRAHRPPAASPPAGPEAERRRARLLELARQADELSKAGQWEETLRVLEQVREIAPDNPPVLRSLARVYEKLGMTEKAREVQRRLDAVSARLPRPPAAGAVPVGRQEPIRREFPALAEAADRNKWEGALRSLEAVRWEKRADGSYVVSAPVKGMRHLVEIYNQLSPHAKVELPALVGEARSPEAKNAEVAPRDRGRRRDRE